MKYNKHIISGEWAEIIKNSPNPRVLTMLSGGKDSIAALCILKELGLDITAIHFIHRWCSDIPTNEAKRICQQLDIPLKIYDFTDEFYDSISGFTDGRPCALCKKNMYRILIGYLNENDYGWLCIGDTLNDRTTIMRMKSYISEHPDENLECSTYFGSEMGLKLPDGVKVVRPLIAMTAAQIEQFLKSICISVNRINSTGDKYFEYHREGCFIQFADMGVPLNNELCDMLKEYNDVITEFARNKGILASIHMPSGFIVTIPKGYENEAMEYLEEKGLSVDKRYNESEGTETLSYSAIVEVLNVCLLETGAYRKLFSRFVERLELENPDMKIIQAENNIICTAHTYNTELKIVFDFEHQKSFIFYMYDSKSHCLKDYSFFENLIIELFRTRKYKLLS